MSTRDLTGTELAAAIRADVTERAGALADAGHPITLAVVSATKDESSQWYVRAIERAATKVGIACQVVELADDATPATIRAALHGLSADPSVHGVMLQTPLPAGAELADLAEAVTATKDVDGANPVSLGRLVAGLPAFAPATAAAVVELLDFHQVPIAGRQVVVVGRSTVVGKPVAQLFLDRHATVTVCHSRTTDLPSVTRTGDIVVAAAGRAGLVTDAHLRPGAIVVDVGTNPTEDGGLVGDVADSAAAQAAALTPVPGGVGPVTTALLLRHTVTAATLTLGSLATSDRP